MRTRGPRAAIKAQDAHKPSAPHCHRIFVSIARSARGTNCSTRDSNSLCCLFAALTEDSRLNVGHGLPVIIRRREQMAIGVICDSDRTVAHERLHPLGREAFLDK